MGALQRIVEENPAVVFVYLHQVRYGLHALAGSLEACGELEPPRLLFPRREEELLGLLPEVLRRHRRALVAFSLMTPFAPASAALAARIRREVAGDLFLVAGGPHATGDPGGTLALGFDAAVVGEGEEAFRDLVRAWRSGSDLAAVAGLALPAPGGSFALAAPRRPIDLDAFPSFAAAHHKVGPIEISRGCPFGCPFCQTSYLFGRRMRHRSLESIVRHAGTLAGLGVRDIRFISPNAFAWGSAGGRRPEPERLDELLRAVLETLPRGGRVFLGSFPSEVRPEFVTPETVEVVRRRASNTMLVLGAQSGSPRQLEALGRGHTPDDVRRAVRLARAAGLTPYVDYIFGLPEETAEDVELTLAQARELAGLGAVIHAHPFMPLPGTPWAAAPARKPAPRVRRALSELAARGALYGDWRRKQAAVGAGDAGERR